MKQGEEWLQTSQYSYSSESSQPLNVSSECRLQFDSSSCICNNQHEIDEDDRYNGDNGQLGETEEIDEEEIECNEWTLDDSLYGYAPDENNDPIYMEYDIQYSEELN